MRQGVADRSKLTRAQVAKRLGRDVSWVRRREGHILHPTIDKQGVHWFSAIEVDSLRDHLAATAADEDVSDAAVAAAYGYFAHHARCPTSVSLEGIADRTGIDHRTIRAMHAKWMRTRLEEGLATPHLLSRQKLQTLEQRECEAMQREYDARMAQIEREDAEHRRKRAVQRKQDEQERAARDAARNAKRAQQQAPPSRPQIAFDSAPPTGGLHVLGQLLVLLAATGTRARSGRPSDGKKHMDARNLNDVSPSDDDRERS